MTDNRLFLVGYCPSCGTGPLGVRLCGQCGRAHVLCDECDAMWLSRDTSVPAIFPSQPDIPCHHCQHSLRDQASHWATLDELVKLAWDEPSDGAPPDPPQTKAKQSQLSRDATRRKEDE